MQTKKELHDWSALAQQFDPHRLTEEVIKLGEAWADQDAAASILEETKKTMLAKLATEYIELSAPKTLSASAAELRALSDPRYETHLQMMVKSRQEANRLRVRYDMGRMKLELMRSLQATIRNEMRMTS